MHIPFELSGLADVALFLAGTLACASHPKLSRWMWAMLLSFAGPFLTQSAAYLIACALFGGSTSPWGVITGVAGRACGGTTGPAWSS